MKNSLMWRGLTILAVVLTMAFSLYPASETINLGLDLRGGTHLVPRVHTEDALRAETDKTMEALRRKLIDDGIAGAQGLRTTDNKFELTGLTREQDDVLSTAAEDILPLWDYSWDGSKVTFERPGSEQDRVKEEAVKQVLSTIRNRIDQFGVAEPMIARQGLSGDRLIIQLPGVDDPERVKELIGQTAALEFRRVEFPASGGGVRDRQAILSNYGGQLPADVEIFEQEIRDPDTGAVTDRIYYGLNRATVITGGDLRNSRPTQGEFGEPVVGFDLTPAGAELFAEFTGDNIGRAMAVVLDGKIQTAPTIQSRIRDSGIITGQYTATEVEDLVTVLKSGALPADLTFLEERTVGPSLGQDSIEKGTRAFYVAALLVVLAMLLVYKLTGINAVVALSLNFVLVFGALAYLGATLTLPGIVGIILTIGMAVDANVLVFERIREELRNGRTVKAAIQSGFAKAFSSIFDANLTTLIAALFLFQFGTGPIRGFAVTLSIGIIASVFTAVFVSRWLFDLFFSRRARVEKLSI